MTWRVLKSAWIWIAGVVALTALAVTIGIVVTLFPHAHAIPDDQLAAGATILGGLIGAAGTAFAVYLTLASQRRDEAQRVEAALRMEVAEFGRLALGALGVCEEVLAGRLRPPLRDLPALMAMPEAVVYRATADRISRLPYGSLFVVLHARVAEAAQMAALEAVAGRPFLQDGRGTPDPLIDDTTAKTLATGWFDVCTIAQTILRPGADAPQLADAVIAATLTDLDAAHARVGALLNPPAAAPP